MQWMDENGVVYGEDPHHGAGPAYPYGAAYPVQADHWTGPTGDVRAAQTAPYAAGTSVYDAGPPPATTAWDDGFHGDVLVVPPSEPDPFAASAPGADPYAYAYSYLYAETDTYTDTCTDTDAVTGAEAGAPQSEHARPVFVDSSGRRQRRVLRAARLLTIPAGGYVALLISAMLGGPSLSAPFVPQPDSPHGPTPHASAPDSAAGTGHSTQKPGPAAAQADSRPTATRTSSGPTAGATASPTSAATSAAAPAPTAVASPTAAATDASSRGRALGSSHKPVK